MLRTTQTRLTSIEAQCIVSALRAAAQELRRLSADECELLSKQERKAYGMEAIEAFRLANVLDGCLDVTVRRDREANPV